MQIYNSLYSINSEQPTVLTIGNFDGVHRGHQALLQTLKATAEAISPQETRTALITFDPHPLTLLRPHLPLNLLTTPQERMQIAAGLGIDVGLILPFTAELAAMEARDFLSLLKTQLSLCALVVGPDFALGRNRSGTLDILAALGQELDYQLIVQEHIAIGEHSVRSRAVRELLGTGDVQQAATLLGRPYHMAGPVVHGDQRGRDIGVPTANVDIPANKLWPADGVYITRTWIMDTGDEAKPVLSVSNAGYRPTVNGSSRRLETHLLDFPAAGQSGDLYGKRLVVEFIERLRGEIRFSSLQELVEQIQKDISQARKWHDDTALKDKPFFAVKITHPPNAN